MSETMTTEAIGPGAPSAEKRVALCLSGGGFRASLFHLGTIRRLNELGTLAHVDTISSVSGGSILAAHMATVIRKWPAPGTPMPDFEAVVAAPFREFARANLRTWPVLKGWLPWNLARHGAQSAALAERYRKRLTRLLLSQLPERPNYVLCATDMVFAVNWVMERSRVGDFQAGYCEPDHRWTLARAVAASSCFPPVFDPMPVNLEPGELTRGKHKAGRERDALIRRLRISDGGLYDNLGLQPALGRHTHIIASDGGAPFPFQSTESRLHRLWRYTAITGEQVGKLRRSSLLSDMKQGNLQGTYWGISSAPSSYGGSQPLGYSKQLAREIIATIRTDLDSFSPAEAAVLENHGYLLADAGMNRHVADLVAPDAQAPVPPFPNFMDEAVVRGELAESGKRKLLGRWSRG